MNLRSKQRAVIEFLYHEGIKQSEIAVRLKQVYKEHAFNRSTVSRWLARFKSSTFVEENNEENVTTLKTLADETRSGRPPSAMTTDKQLKKNKLIKENRGITVRETSEELEISLGSTHSIIKSLGYRKICAKWVPKKMTENQKQTRVDCCRDLTQMAQANPDFFERYITGDETWVYYYDPESRQQSMEWCHPNSPRPKKFRAEKSGKKLLATVFWDIYGVICVDFLPRGVTMDSEMYIQTLKKLRARIYRVRPGLEMQNVLFHHDNAPSHSSAKTREVIRSYGWTTLPHPPYSPDLAPSDYHLFGPLKAELRGIYHQDDDDLKRAVTTWLRNQPEEFYRRGILDLRQRWTTAITRQGEFIED